MNKRLSKLFATILVTAILLGVMPMIIPAKAQPPSPAFWVVPTMETLYTNTTSVGTLFVVTVMAACPNGTDAWSVQASFDPTQLQAVSVDLNPGPHSGLFAAHAANVTGVTPVIDNIGGSVFVGEVLSGTDYVPATSASVFNVTFNITAAPAPSQTLSSSIDPAYGVSQGETFFLLQSPSVQYPSGSVDSPNTAPCTYSFISTTQVPPLSVSISPLSTLITVGHTVHFTSSVTGGVLPYSYQWYLNSSAVPGATSSTWDYTPAESESDTVYLSVTDSSTTTANSTVASLTVVQPFTGAMLYVDPAEVFSLALGPGSTFSVNVTVSNVSNLGLCIFNLTYVPSVIGCIGIKAFQVQGQFPTLSVIMDGGGGYAWVSLNYSSPISTALAPLAELHFCVNSYGISPLNLTDIQLLDGSGNPISHSQANGLFANIIRDVAVVNVVPSSGFTLQGQLNNINVTVKNLGNMTETFTASAYYDGTLIGSAPVSGLLPNNQATVTITWNTTGVPDGSYTITGVASTVPYEYNLTNNVYVDGVVQVIHLIQDLAITGVVPFFSVAYQGELLSINVTAANLGNRPESFDVNATYDLGLIGTQHVTDLAPGTNITLTFVWNTASVPLGNYTITGACTVLPYETNTADNVLSYSPVAIVIRDLAVTNVTTFGVYFTDWVYQGQKMQINVTSKNLGTLSESFNVSAYYNTTQLIGTQYVSSLAPLASITMSFIWDTTGVPCHNYTITGTCTILPYDANVTNNSYSVGNVTVRILGDVNGDGMVDIRDVHLASIAFGTRPGNPAWNPAADVNGDGVIDIRDISIISKHFGTSATY